MPSDRLHVVLHVGCGPQTIEASQVATFTVTISCGRYGDDDRLPVDGERLAVVLERVRATSRGERRGEPDARDAAAAVRLVEPEDDRVGVLGALDRVEHEVRVVDGGERRSGIAAVQRSGALKRVASATTPASRQPPACGSSA